MLPEAVQRPDDIKQQVSVSSQHVDFAGKGNLAIVEEKPLGKISDLKDPGALTTQARETDIICFPTVTDVMSRVQLALVDYNTLKVIPNLWYPRFVSTLSPVFLTLRRVRIHVKLQRKLQLCLQLSTTRIRMLEFLGDLSVVILDLTEEQRKQFVLLAAYREPAVRS